MSFTGKYLIHVFWEYCCNNIPLLQMVLHNCYFLFCWIRKTTGSTDFIFNLYWLVKQSNTLLLLHSSISNNSKYFAKICGTEYAWQWCQILTNQKTWLFIFSFIYLFILKVPISNLDPKIWDLLPKNIKDSENINIFKSNVKLWKPENCPYRICLIYLAIVRQCQVDFMFSVTWKKIQCVMR